MSSRPRVRGIIAGMADDLKGRLLVASPKLLDPNFYRSVVLVLEHDDEDGALGVVLNRPSETELAEALEGWEEVAAEPTAVFVGGPVQPEVAVCLASPRPEAEPPGFQRLLDWVGSLDVSQDPAIAGAGVGQLRVFAGYAGWDLGQIEGEVDRGDWFVLDPLPSDVFDADPEDLWKRVLRRQRGDLRLVAEFPPHPMLN